MKAVRQELIICGDNADIVKCLSKNALLILEQAKDVKNIKINSVNNTEPNVRIEYMLHPAGQGWLE